VTLESGVASWRRRDALAEYIVMHLIATTTNGMLKDFLGVGPALEESACLSRQG
jgi:hypothetical protein